MKKTLIAVAAAAALATSSAFAEITFGAWLRAIAVPVGSTGEEIVTGITNSWGGGARTARLDVNAVSEDGMAGFAMGVFNDFSDGLGQGDRAVLWVKPVDMLKVSLGKFDSPDNGLRGDFTYGSWNWLKPYNWLQDGEGLTFDGVSKNGLMVELDPVEGLHIFAAVPLAGGSSFATTAEDTYRNVQVGFGYSIADIGRIKAQFIGDYEEGVDGDKTGEIGVAFDLTAVENLYVTIGGRFGIADKDEFADYEKVSVLAGVSYQVTDEFKVSVDGGFRMFQDKCRGKDGDDDMAFGVGAGIDYALMDGLALAADVRYMSIGGKDDDGTVSFLVGVNKSVGSNGSIGIGFQGSTNGCGFIHGNGWSDGLKAGWNKDGEANDADQFCWAIPVSVSVWF
ncbi:MAG: outer membrane beta-barrel protein [Treponema sp.]|nr:outer membrane beta-barrel protein [Treponema sp.]